MMTPEEVYNSIEKLSELRSKYSCFDEKEEPFYRALSLGINAICVEQALEQEPKTETVTEFADRCRECGKMRTGYWIDDKCSICGKGIEDLIDGSEWYINEKPNFCPFCGVKLVDEQESEDKNGQFSRLCKGGKLPNGGWTPIREGLPKEGKSVIASTFYGVYPEARYTKENGWEWAYEAGADYWEKLECVEAWMSLPAKYEPQEE